MPFAFVSELRRLRVSGPADLEDEVGLFVPVGETPLDGGMVGKLSEPERPRLFRQVPLGRIAVLVERLEVAEYPRDPLPAKMMRLRVRHIPSRLELDVRSECSKRTACPRSGPLR